MNKEALYYMMEASDNDDLPDGAWWHVLEDCVTYWNKKNKTKFDPNSTVHAYLKWKEKNP